MMRPLIRRRVTLAALAGAAFILAGLAAAPLRAGGCDAGAFALAIDIGHYPEAPGAISARGVAEHVFNRELAAAVLGSLRRAGFRRAHLLDAEGALPKLPARVQRLRELAPPLLLSIHHDSVQPQYLDTWSWQGRKQRYSDRFRGFSLFVSRRNGDFPRSLAAARRIGESLIAAGFRPTLHHAEDIDGERRPLLDAGLGVYAGDGLAILAHDAAPAVLIEAGVIVHRDEELEVAGAAFRSRFAGAVANAVRLSCAETPTTEGYGQ